MSENVLKNVRIVHKHDIEENWLKATNFIPKQGELIIYDVDNEYNYERMKIGDGKTNVNLLPFENVQSDWNQNNETELDFVKNRTHYSIESKTNTLTFDGDISNKEYIELEPNVVYAVKVASDAIISIENIIGGNVVVSDGEIDEAYRVKNDELVEFPYGYHTTVSTPGYQTYFLWLMAGDYQGFNRSSDPDHAWIENR